MTAIADEFVAFDLETTGLSPKVDRIIEIGAVRFDAHGNPVATLDLLVDPGIPIPLAIQRLVGLSNSDVAGAPTPVEGLAQLADLCEGAHLVGHGTTLDMAFCTALLPDTFGRRMIFDTLDLARIFLPRNLSHSLPLLTLELGLGDHRAHRAYSDADATRRLFLMLAEVAAGLPTATVAEMRRVAAQGGGALEAFLSLPLLSSASPGVSAPRPSSASVPEPRSEAPGQAVPVTPLPEAAARLLAPD
ncbi:MAG TPA: 3'-5' exonuclease, partial [Candidatus Sulfotelmatobacter sp.]|nr:3'-5' exonuclease [Candidatus Sulfotelmatobacter sp.]